MICPPVQSLCLPILFHSAQDNLIKDFEVDLISLVCKLVWVQKHYLTMNIFVCSEIKAYMLSLEKIKQLYTAKCGVKANVEPFFLIFIVALSGEGVAYKTQCII